MSQYLLSICYPAGASQPPPDALERIRTDVAAVNRAMQDAGVWVFAGALQPPHTATVVQATGREILTTDGPFIESKEQIGGICVIRAADLDEALKWGERISRATSTPVEVRPMQSHDR
jgi:hypothetical protein